MYQGFIPITVVIERLSKHVMFKNFSEADIIDYAVEVIDLLSDDTLYDYKTVNAEIIDYRASIPQDCREIVGVKVLNNGTNTIPVPINMRYGTDKFQANFSEYTETLKQNVNAKYNDFSYIIRGNYLHTNMESGVCNIFYKTRLTDEDGTFLIPDSASYLRAMEMHIKLRMFENMMIYDSYVQNLEQDYYFYLGKAQSEQHRKSDDELIGIANMYNTLYSAGNDLETDYRNINKKEYLRRH